MNEWNGMEWNGMEWNGMEWNGIEWNGMEWNRMEWEKYENTIHPILRNLPRASKQQMISVSLGKTAQRK